MKKLRNYVWALPITLMIIVTLLASACSVDSEVRGNPEWTMKMVEQQFDSIWVSMAVMFSIMILLALYFWYELNKINKKLINKGINV